MSRQDDPVSLPPAFKRLENLRNADILVLSPTPTVPIDQGNRKRIYAVCTELKRQGARIHFVHYPVEWWFSWIPTDNAAKMAAQWDSFHLVPVTRPSHARAVGDDHMIDEWWDPAIGDYIRWLFGRNHYDAFIVNYTYLSKAFEYAPPEVLRVLDTHDKFTDRRLLLESNGVAREFFYTTREQEAIALERAHLVWAIKEEEAVFFRSIASKPCIALPHCEPFTEVTRRRKPEDEGYLVVGMIGAYNSINISNARTFVDEVIPLLKKTLAPVKLRLAGGMCEGIKDLAERPGVELMGRIDSVEEFYEALDVVTIPLVFSTGLKIKAVEAFAHGMPIVAMAHAVEGIPVQHPYHLCHSLGDISRALMNLAHDRAALAALKRASLDTYRRLEEMADAAIAQTAAMLGKRQKIIFLVDKEFLNPASLYREHIIHCTHYLRHLGQIVFYFDQPLRGSQATLFERFNGLSTFGKVCIDPAAADPAQGSIGMMSFVAPLAEVIGSGARTAIWAFRIPTELPQVPPAAAARVRVYVRTDAIRLCQPQAPAALGALMKTFPSTELVDCSDIHRNPDLSPMLDRTRVQLRVPFWRWKPWQIGQRVDARVDILTCDQTLAAAQVIADAIDEWWPDRSPTRLLIAGTSKPAASKRPWVHTAAALRDFAHFQSVPQCAIDIGFETELTAIYVESIGRVGVKVWRPEDWHGSMAMGGTTLSGLFQSVQDIVAPYAGATPAPEYMDARYDNDAGWTTIWNRHSIEALLS